MKESQYFYSRLLSILRKRDLVPYGVLRIAMGQLSAEADECLDNHVAEDPAAMRNFIATVDGLLIAIKRQPESKDILLEVYTKVLEGDQETIDMVKTACAKKLMQEQEK